MQRHQWGRLETASTGGSYLTLAGAGAEEKPGADVLELYTSLKRLKKERGQQVSSLSPISFFLIAPTVWSFTVLAPFMCSLCSWFLAPCSLHV